MILLQPSSSCQGDSLTFASMALIFEVDSNCKVQDSSKPLPNTAVLDSSYEVLMQKWCLLFTPNTVLWIKSNQLHGALIYPYHIVPEALWFVLFESWKLVCHRPQQLSTLTFIQTPHRKGLGLPGIKLAAFLLCRESSNHCTTITDWRLAKTSPFKCHRRWKELFCIAHIFLLLFGFSCVQ